MPLSSDPASAAMSLLDRTVRPRGGSTREAQQDLAVEVAVKVASGRNLIAEAGTGLGKSFAYLCGALAATHKQVLVATAGTALQDQLVGKDLPAVAEAWKQITGKELSFAQVKGANQYLCRAKLAEPGDGKAGKAEQVSLLDDPAPAPAEGAEDEIGRLVAWAGRTGSGDRAELDFEPSKAAWDAVSTSANDCTGTKCPHADTCFLLAARRNAKNADVLVVNQHLLLADVASGGNILPEARVLIVDEAHELPDVATGAFSTRLDPDRLRGVASTVRAAVSGGAANRLTALAGGPNSKTGLHAELVRLTVPAGDRPGSRSGRQGRSAGDEQRPGSARLKDGVAGVPSLADVLAAVDQVVAVLAGETSRAVRAAEGDPKASGRALRAQKAVTNLRNDLADLAGPPLPGHVVWVEPGEKPVLNQAPLDVSARLAASLWRDRPAVLCSATVPINLGQRTGLPATPGGSGTAARVDKRSPFPYKDCARLYVPRLPSPKLDRGVPWEKAALAETSRLVARTNGGALILSTSLRMAQLLADRVRADHPHITVYAHGDLPKPQLIARFADEPDSVLVGSRALWTGVSVDGAACRLVVIDKLPFQPPGDPLVDARRDEAGREAFARVDLPHAATLLAQGVGRLIRTTTDKGIVAVLDERLITTLRPLLDRLPPMGRIRNWDQADQFISKVMKIPDPAPIAEAG